MVITTDETVETRVVALDLAHRGSVAIVKIDETVVDSEETGQEDLDVVEGSEEAALKIVMVNATQMNALPICVLVRIDNKFNTYGLRHGTGVLII